MNSSFLKAGAAQVDITPPLGTFINGDFISHYATRIHDPLYSKALVMQDSKMTIALVVVDICIMPKDFIDEVKQDVFNEAGIEPKNVMISSTHTHAGGSIEGILLGATDLPYRKKLSKMIRDSVGAALKNIKPAEIGFGSVNAPEHVVCRRYFMKEGYTAKNPVTGGIDKVKTNPIGVEAEIVGRVSQMDTDLNYIALRGTDGKWISVLANYSMHYVGDWPNGTICADYFGSFARHLSAKMIAADDFVVMLSNGTSGDANIWDFLQPHRYPKEDFKKNDYIAKDLAAKVVANLQEVQWESTPCIEVQYDEIYVPVRKPTSVELEDAKKIIQETNYEQIVADEDGLKRLYAREQVLLNEYPNSVVFPIQVIKIGSGAIGALAGEFFAETGIWLKQRMPAKKYFTVTLANGYYGYVPPKHEIEQGGYETWRCRTSFLYSEKEIREKLAELYSIEKLSNVNLLASLEVSEER
jgi:neutral ceramidase